MVGSMYQAETPSGLSKYKENEKGKTPHSATPSMVPVFSLTIGTLPW